MKRYKEMVWGCLCLSIFLIFGFTSSKVGRTAPYQASSSIQSKALQVLENKCNTCHAQKRKSVVFTEKNMNSHARDISTQVFVKKRMPKGKEKLTPEESKILKDWLSNLGL